jgi:hypothetical protein
MARWAAFATAVVDGPSPPNSDRSLFLSPGLEGGGELSGRLDAAGFEVVDTALAAAMTDDADGEARTPAQRRADALVAVCAAALDHGERPPTTRRRRPHVSVVVTLEELVGGPTPTRSMAAPSTPPAWRRCCATAASTGSSPTAPPSSWTPAGGCAP